MSKFLESAFNIKEYRECKDCRSWQKFDEQGKCVRCGHVIASGNQGPSPGNDPAVLRKYLLEV